MNKPMAGTAGPVWIMKSSGMRPRKYLRTILKRAMARGHGNGRPRFTAGGRHGRADGRGSVNAVSQMARRCCRHQREVRHNFDKISNGLAAISAVTGCGISSCRVQLGDATAFDIFDLP